MATHPGTPRNVMPPGLRNTQQQHRTFDASGQEVGWLKFRLNNDNFLNREGSGGAQAPMTRTGLANKRKAFLLFEVAAMSWESTLFLPTKCQAKCSVSSAKTKCPEHTYTLPFIGSVTSHPWFYVGTSQSQWQESL